jgi:hypothetical protein
MLHDKRRDLEPSEAVIAQPPEPFVDSIKAAAFLSIRPRHLLALARAGVIPAHPLGTGQRKLWRFRLSELQTTLLQSRVEPNTSFRVAPVRGKRVAATPRIAIRRGNGAGSIHG